MTYIFITIMSSSDILKEYFLVIEINKQLEQGNQPETLPLMDSIQENEHWSTLIERSFDSGKLKEYYSSLSLPKRSSVFKFGISCFVHFIQANFTGPELSKDIIKIIDIPEASYYVANFLCDDEINVNIKFPILLVASKCIFENCLIEKIVNLLWILRSLIIHQQIMEEFSPLLLSAANDLKMQIDTFNLQGRL